MKRQPTELGEIFANDATHKGFVYKIYKQHMQLCVKKKKKIKINNPIKKWAEGLNRSNFLQRRHTDGQKAHEKMLNITNYWRNANPNYSKISPHTSQNSRHQKIHK